jgi:predicted RNA binding protein YcfA (HicA-like mRNA interferase family)
MPSWSDLEHYLKRNEWKLVRQSGRDKIYEKTMPDGVIRRTAVSKSSSEIGKGLFSRILKQQLGIDKEEFNS